LHPYNWLFLPTAVPSVGDFPLWFKHNWSLPISLWSYFKIFVPTGLRYKLESWPPHDYDFRLVLPISRVAPVPEMFAIRRQIAR
jgi:hypothetical protein